MTKLIIVLSFVFSFSAVSAPFLFNEFREEIKEMAEKNHQSVSSYSQARKEILQKVHLEKDSNGYFVKDVYCKIDYRTKVGPNTMPNSNYLNIEHTWPKSKFGVRKGTSKYNIMVSDLHHLYPSDSKANSTRSNHAFAQFKNGQPLSDCPFSKIDYDASSGKQGFEPPEDHKGNVARALFYMAVRYDLKISASEEFYLKQWNIMDPVDSEEIRRNNEIADIQGNRNPFVDDSELVELIQDF